MRSSSSDLQFQTTGDGEGVVGIGQLHAHHPAGGAGVGGDGGKIVVEQVEPAGVGPVFVQVGQNGLASGGLVGEGEGDLGLLYQLHLTVGDDHGGLGLRAGFINAVLNGDAQRHAGGGSKEVGIDGAQHVVAQALGIADRQIDGAAP